MSREMTSEEIKDFLRKEIEHNWKHVRECREIIELYQQRKELTDTESKCYEIFKEDKTSTIKETIMLENLFRTFFKIDYYEER